LVPAHGACAIGRTNPDDCLWRIWPYIGALVISLLIIAAIRGCRSGFCNNHLQASG
jgi:TRAP-type C4-dicarboxylate transport system permease large subunit